MGVHNSILGKDIMVAVSPEIFVCMSAFPIHCSILSCSGVTSMSIWGMDPSGLVSTTVNWMTDSLVLTFLRLSSFGSCSLYEKSDIIITLSYPMEVLGHPDCPILKVFHKEIDY